VNNRISNKSLIVAASLLCFFAVILSTTIGIADISFGQTIRILLVKLFHVNLDMSGVKESAVTIVWLIRFPRVMLAFFVGGALAVCGASYQGIFKNPMADPFILGVSSGAALGATLGIIAHLDFSFMGFNAVSMFAFIGALASLFTVYNISKIGRKVPVDTLLLSGIAIGQFLSAIISMCMVFSYDFQSIILWTMGSFNAKSWNQLILAAPLIVIGLIVVYASSRELDIMLLGEDTAAQLGVDTERLKMKILISTALVTAAAVSVTGIIGFVGLIIPHIVRLITGPKHKKLLPYSFVIGGIFMILCDTIARSLMSTEIPVGCITAIFGGPFFVYLLKKRRSGRL